MISQKEQDIIISAICFADDHDAGFREYAIKFLKREGISYNEDHENFLERYVHEVYNY